MSADGTACLWPTCHPSPSSKQPQAPRQTFQLTASVLAASRSSAAATEDAALSSGAFIPSQRNRFVCGFTNGRSGIFDLETGQLTSLFQPNSGNDVSVSVADSDGLGSIVISLVP